MSVLNGTNLRLQLDGNTVACAKSCTLSMEKDLLDATCKDSGGAKEHITGNYGWSLEVTALLNFAATVGITELGTALINGTSFTALFNTGDSGDTQWTGTVDPSSLQITSNDNEVIEYSGTLQGTGALTQSATA